MKEAKKMGYCVNGEWKESKTSTYIDVTDSSTGEVIAQVPSCTAEEVEEAIASAQAAFPAWSKLSLAKRQQYMFRWRDVLYAHKEELAVLCVHSFPFPADTSLLRCSFSSDLGTVSVLSSFLCSLCIHPAFTFRLM